MKEASLGQLNVKTTYFSAQLNAESALLLWRFDTGLEPSVWEGDSNFKKSYLSFVKTNPRESNGFLLKLTLLTPARYRAQ